MLINGRRLLRALGLFGLLVAVYFATYTGQNISTDELRLYDAANSYLKHHTLELAYTNDLVRYSTQPGTRPVVWLDSEPMQAYAAVPLLWLAAHIPGIGMMQTVWLLNILVTALTAVVLFYLGVMLGYSERSAIIVALLFGLATIVWPYTQMFFREPLFTLMMLICALSLERLRRGLEATPRRYAALGWLIIAGVTFRIGLSTKEAGLLIVPALVLIVLPGVPHQWRNWRGLTAALMLGLLAIAAAFGLIQLVSHGHSIFARLQLLDLRYAGEGVAAFLFGPGFSPWTFSPVLIAGLIGAVWLVRQGKFRYVLAPFAALLAIVISYSTLHGTDWYGGTGWGARYLLPAIPFMALWLLPIVEGFRRLKLWLRALIIGLTVQSVFIQIIAVLVPTHAFANYLGDESARLGHAINPWQDGIWNPLYIPQAVNAHQSATAPSAIAWISTGTGAIVLPLCAIVALIAVLALIGRFSLPHKDGGASRPPFSPSPSLRGEGAGVRGRLGLGRNLKWVLLGVAVPVSVVVLLWVGLRAYYHDQRFGGDNATLWKVMDALNAGIKPGDGMILNNKTYQLFFMNYYKSYAPLYEMPDAPGERLAPGEPPAVVSEYPDEQAHRYSAMMLSRIALITSRWWFLTEYTPTSPGRIRVTENFLVRHYFASDKVVDEPEARLLLFAPVSAPADRVPPWPEYPINADFGAAALVGIDLPNGMQYKPGALLPVSLLWRHDGWPSGMTPFDYSVNISLIDSTGAAVAQHAATPVGSFGLMSQWMSASYYRDNHALQLSDHLAPGDYSLWALVFDWRDSKPLPVYDSAGKSLGDHVVLARIHIAAP